MKSLVRQFITVLTTALFLVPPVFGAEKTVASGNWTRKEYSVSGSWKIVEDAGVTKLKLVGFKTKSAPDLKIFFSTKPLSQLESLNGGILTLAS